MPIIIDNFQVNTNAPIDNRFVVGPGLFYTNKDDIQYKYVGLRVWDSNTNLPFYWNGIEWLSENTVGVLADTNSLFAGESGYITKFTTGPTVVGKSLIYENQTTKQLGIGLTGGNINANYGSNSVQFGLHVAGNIKTNSYFIGNGLYINDINASNINSGLLNIQHISPTQNSTIGFFSAVGNSATNPPIIPGNNYVLFNNGFGTVNWRNMNNLSVLNSTNTTNVNVINDTSTPIVLNTFLTFVQTTTGNLPIKVSSSKLQFNPGTGQLFLNNGSVTNPVYSFLNSTNTGIYYNQGMSIAIDGSEITSTKDYGFIINNRVYIPTTSNNTDVGYGIVWSINGNSTNLITTNDGFVYNGQRLNRYGLGSHIPTNSGNPSGRGTYISGYFGVDIFSGIESDGVTGRLKIKVDENNDVTINSRLNINNIETLGSTTNNNRVLKTIQNHAGSFNNVIIKDWSVRSEIVPNTSTQDSWLTWKHHNGITVDGIYNTPNTIDGTLTFWERHPFLREHYFGSLDRKTLTINSNTSPFVKIDGLLNVLGSINGNTTISGNWIATNVEAVNTTIDNKVMTPMKTKTAISAIKSTSSVLSYIEGNTITWSHGLLGIPDFATVTFICKQAIDSYQIGDRIQVFPTSEPDVAHEGYSLRKTAISIIIRIAGNGAGLYVTPNGGSTFLKGANWNIEITAYKF
jgi:hypothetical protein